MEEPAIHAQPILLAIILLSEYGIKQWIETNADYYMFNKPRLTYVAFLRIHGNHLAPFPVRTATCHLP